jgi:hypothetical protein
MTMTKQEAERLNHAIYKYNNGVDAVQDVLDALNERYGVERTLHDAGAGCGDYKSSVCEEDTLYPSHTATEPFHDVPAA